LYTETIVMGLKHI